MLEPLVDVVEPDSVVTGNSSLLDIDLTACTKADLAFDAPFRIGDIAVIPFDQDHGSIPSVGLRFGPIGYSNDVVALDDAAFAALEGVEIWIVDAMRHRPHPTHAHLDLTLEWIARLKPRRAILTNMHLDLDYRTLCKDLPEGVEPAYDGMVLEA